MAELKYPNLVPSTGISTQERTLKQSGNKIMRKWALRKYSSIPFFYELIGAMKENNNNEKEH